MSASLDLPFRFTGADLERADGRDLVRAQVRNVLLTEPGELPWRLRFGAGVARLRHRRADDVTVELARVTVRDALRRWLPSVAIDQVDVAAVDERVDLRVAVSSRDGTGNVSVEVGR